MPDLRFDEINARLDALARRVAELEGKKAPKKKDGA